MFNIIEMATGWNLDLVIRRARPFSVEEMKRRVQMAGQTGEVHARDSRSMTHQTT
ncbi:MAG TPA: hypothetical protein VF516_10525 [Kofleriaceae bacterium]